MCKFPLTEMVLSVDPYTDIEAAAYHGKAYCDRRLCYAIADLDDDRWDLACIPSIFD